MVWNDDESVLEYVMAVELKLPEAKDPDDAGVFTGGKAVEVIARVANERIDALVELDVFMLDEGLTLDEAGCLIAGDDVNLLDEVAVDFLEEEEEEEEEDDDVTGSCATNTGTKFDAAGLGEVCHVTTEPIYESQ